MSSPRRRGYRPAAAHASRRAGVGAAGRIACASFRRRRRIVTPPPLPPPATAVEAARRRTAELVVERRPRRIVGLAGEFRRPRRGVVPAWAHHSQRSAGRNVDELACLGRRCRPGAGRHRPAAVGRRARFPNRRTPTRRKKTLLSTPRRWTCRPRRRRSSCLSRSRSKISRRSSARRRGDRRPGGPAAARSSQAPTGGGWEGRNPADRAATAGGSRGGGTKQSEEAVERGLRWLVAHQRDDGSWCFDLTKAPCNGMCRNSGSEASTTAATGLALLPFLGAGYTQRQGEYQETVKTGIVLLEHPASGHAARRRPVRRRHDVRPGNRHDRLVRSLRNDPRRVAEGHRPGSDSLHRLWRRICRGGGWRDTPGKPGDTTVTGWQLMALKSGQMAKLEVPSPTISLVEKFLEQRAIRSRRPLRLLTDAASARRGKRPRPSGLLCRMYTGWHRDRPALYRGVAHLHKWGPSETNMYYDYYATQVLHHWEGPEWQAWNKPMRDYLVATQADRKPRERQLVFPRSLRRPRRPALQHGHGHHDPRSLLPLHAALRPRSGSRPVLSTALHPTVGPGRGGRRRLSAKRFPFCNSFSRQLPPSPSVSLRARNSVRFLFLLDGRLNHRGSPGDIGTDQILQLRARRCGIGRSQHPDDVPSDLDRSQHESEGKPPPAEQQREEGVAALRL